MNLTQRAALEQKLGKGGWTGDALEKALRGACVVPDRSPKFPAATLVVEVILGQRYMFFHFEGDTLLGASNP